VLDKRCLFSALRDDEAVLRSRVNDRFKLKALKYFSHWVGDIHQPFHVSYQDDRGGNQVYLTKDSACKKNLHAVWDRCILNHVFSQFKLSPRSGKDRQQFAERIYKQISEQQKRIWTRDLSAITWANESLVLVRCPDLKYCYLQGQTCQYTKNSKYHIYRGKNKNSRSLKLTEFYLDAMKELNQQRIQQAAIRLAAKLNDIFK